MKLTKIILLISGLILGASANSLCGNGVKDLNEACDGSDSKHVGWGSLGCDENCKSVEAEESCQQTFYFKLRHGRSYGFGMYFFNKTDVPIKIKNKPSVFNSYVYKSEQGDYNKDTLFPIFIPTEIIKKKKGIINPGKYTKYIKSTEETRYPIITYPRYRSLENFVLKYKLSYTKLINHQEKGYFIHNTCAYYEITRCGDGIKDWYTETDGTEIHEKCDPNDPKHKGWGQKGCSNSCTPKN